MAKIEFVHLSEINEKDIIKLMNNEIVGKQLPLLVDGFSMDQCLEFLTTMSENDASISSGETRSSPMDCARTWLQKASKGTGAGPKY